MTEEEIFKAARQAFEAYAADRYPFDNAKTDMQKLQAQLSAWEGRNFGCQPSSASVLGSTEELGELAEMVQAMRGILLNAQASNGRLAQATLKNAQGIRGMSDVTKYQVKAGDSIADTAVYLMQSCTALRLDFETLLSLTARRVMNRDWNKDPLLGGECVEETTSV